MNPADEYASRVRRAMVGMDTRVREDIVRELRAHLADSAASAGGDDRVAIARMGPPAQVARGYKRVYGYGLLFRILFVAVAVGLAVPSVPVLTAGEAGLAPYDLSLPFLGALLAWLLWVGARGGSPIGLVAGVAAAASRLAALGAVAAVEPGATAAVGGAALFLASCGVLVLLGWLPGTARKAWSGPKAEL
ncbi:MAG TPA: hypothetical protein VJ326_04395 [Thermoplasmata archaeon]|nr:hypothetical protein [Thermoplasmata archaeon]